MSYEDIVVTTDEHVQLIVINRPEVDNTLGARTFAELTDAVRRCPGRAMIITGSNGTFCRGHEIEPGEAPPPSGVSLTPLAGALLNTDIPVIAAVNGPALGWGMELAMMADIRVASNRASFGELFVLRGLSCDVAGLTRLAQAVGREKAAELLFTGREVGADEAKDLGLVGRVVAHDDLPETAMTLAQQIASNPPLAVQTIKRGLRHALDPDWDGLGEWVAANLTRLAATEDHREGVASARDDRPPEFVGR
ncbi:MAG: enoyl-CoA hydratase-related protein [Actinomycetota bacterium]